MNYNYRKNKLGIIIDDNHDVELYLFNNSIIKTKSYIYADKYIYKRMIKYKSFGLELIKKGIYI
jgi:hypothetical protein